MEENKKQLENLLASLILNRRAILRNRQIYSNNEKLFSIFCEMSIYHVSIPSFFSTMFCEQVLIFQKYTKICYEDQKKKFLMRVLLRVQRRSFHCIQEPVPDHLVRNEKPAPPRQSEFKFKDKDKATANSWRFNKQAVQPLVCLLGILLIVRSASSLKGTVRQDLS